ncbi:hypothetical protein HNQ79_006237 [Streptomyces candidus]|uniref:Uncharacterized protein n=1 Tax=Streptomyces candidus TaxID=67283 RepID=A0A7X0LSY4_9ACTN|nr:hypothetical protein [Streptomyces candidus]MBB6439725.1 hypothetical protein [Streptomyces candidus]
MNILTAVEGLVEEAKRQIRERVWFVTDTDRTVAAEAATELPAVGGTPRHQQVLLEVDRLEHLREALAAVAIALAHVYGRLAWFLGAAATALSSVLHWRAMPADTGSTFGAEPPTFQQYTEAEEAVRRLRSALTGIAAA